MEALAEAQGLRRVGAADQGVCRAYDVVMAELPQGVVVTPLTPHRDERGWVMEVFSPRFGVSYDQKQWNAVWNRPNAYRGFHVHYEHNDYVTVAKGSATVG